jgi:membrane protein YdbS with pleckstrin-like domain
VNSFQNGFSAWIRVAAVLIYLVYYLLYSNLNKSLYHTNTLIVHLFVTVVTVTVTVTVTVYVACHYFFDPAT